MPPLGSREGLFRAAPLPLGGIQHLLPGAIPGLHPAPFVAFPKKPWKEEGRSKVGTAPWRKILRNYHVALNPIYANVLI